MPIIRSKFRTHVLAQLAEIRTSQAEILARLDNLAYQAGGLAKASTATTILNQLAGLGALLGDDQEVTQEVVVHLNGLDGKVDLLTSSVSHLAAAAQIVLSQPAAGPAETPAPATEQASAAPQARRRGAPR